MNTHEEFRNIIRLERENLTRLSDYWNSQIKNDTSIQKDMQGRIRAAVGKTRLLLSEKFKQFEGLVEQSENHTSEKEISINDLHGFWDLVLIQVNEVKEMFRSLDPLNERVKGTTEPEKSETSKDKKPGYSSKKKNVSDHIEQTEKKLKEINVKDRLGTEARDLKIKLSLSKLSKT